MRARAPALPLLLVLAFLAPGCLSAPFDRLSGAAVPEVPDVWASVRDRLASARCEIASDVSGTTPNFVSLARLDPMDYGPGFHAEMVTRRDARGLHTYQVREFEGAFDVINLDDPLAPRPVGSWQGEPGTYALDVKLSSDGATAIVGDIGRLWVVDVRDPAEPKTIGTWSFPSPYGQAQGHMLSVAMIRGVDRVFAATQQNMGVWIFDLVGEPDARELRPIARYAERLNGPLGPHDMLVVKDPIENVHILYVANGFNGWLAADVSDPANPLTIGLRLPVDAHPSYTHTLQVGFIGERRIVATIAEVGVNALKIYDATDLLLPVLLAEWTDDATDPLALQHNIQLLGTRLYLAHWQRGLFVFDIEDALEAGPIGQLARIEPIARYAVGDEPNSSSIELLTAQYDGLGGVIDVNVEHGVLYLSMADDGLHVVGDACIAAGDPSVEALR